MIDNNFDPFAKEIAARQYFTPQEETMQEMFRRAARVVEDPYLWDPMYDLMTTKRFCPGGRILAGASTPHGNLLNCFVQDGWPHEHGTTEAALHLAKKLALVTRVGGGNGVNLDDFLPKREMDPEDQEFIGNVYITIDPDHPNAPDVMTGTFLDLALGYSVVRGYRTASVKSPEESLGVEDSLYIVVGDDTRSIWDAAATMVDAMLDGRDVIVDLSMLRREGMPVRGSGGTSSGPASFAVEVFDNFATWAKLGAAEFAGPVATLRYLFAPTLRVIRQGGVRRGAGMATLAVTHPDILDFVTSKDLDREQAEGDISTFNISVLVNDMFMVDAVHNEAAEELTTLSKIAQHAWGTGEPGLIYVDQINRHNPLSEIDGPIKATNPCGEVPLYPGEPCDLGAMNVSEYVEKMDDTYFFNFTALMQDSELAAQYLDAILDVENSPLPEIEKQIKDKRRLGLGLMGLADALIKLGIPYGSHESFDFARRVGETIMQGALKFSRRKFIETPETDRPKGLVRAGLVRNNIALTTVAPTGTTAMVMGTTSGIEPLFAPFIYRRVGSEYKQVLHPLFREMMERHRPSSYFCTWKPVESDDPAHEGAHVPDKWDWDLIIKAISDNHGSVQGLTGIPVDVQRVFVCAHDIKPVDHVRMQAMVQDGMNYPGDIPSMAANSISKTINLPKESTVKDVLDIYTLGWELDLKGITVYRDGSRELQVLSTSILEDDGSTVASQNRDEQLGEIIAATCDLDGTCDI